MSDKKPIRADLILEIIGKPPELLIETLNGIVEKIGNEPNVIIIKKDIKEPIKMENNKDLYSSFAEIEINADLISRIAILMFKYMPSYIKIIEPQNITLSNNDWSEILSEISRRLHQYDEIAGILKLQNYKIQNGLKKYGFEITKEGNVVKKDSENENKV